MLITRSLSEELRHSIEKSNLKVIVWSHNFLQPESYRFISRTPQIKCNVFVGKQQYDRYIDNDVIKKSVYIYNFYCDKCNEKRDNDSRTVVFLGAISKTKGFLDMCRIWPGIVKDVPNARLLVMGSGALYGDAKLGKLGIADENFEREFAPYITEENGQIIPSIKFLGIVGAEKEQYFLKSSVGVLNPSVSSETFGMGIVEMATAELPVVTLAKNGYFDTIENGSTGVLGRNLKEIQRNIIVLLKDEGLNNRLGQNAKQFIKRFSPEEIVPQWEKLLDDVYNDRLVIAPCKPSSPISTDFKWIRNIVRFIRFDLKLKFIPSFIDFQYGVYNLLQLIKR